MTDSDLSAAIETVTVDPAIFAQWPDYRVLTILASGLDLTSESARAIAEDRLTAAEEAVRAKHVSDWTTEPHVAAWMEAYKGFGAKPKRTMPSVLALLKRVEGGLPRIDPATDAYNAISIAHALPIGGEDFSAYTGAPRLTIATGNEPFDTTDRGEPVIDHPAAGEVIWRDDTHVTCRRWNWRQGIRTRIVPKTATAIFLLEALGAMPYDDLNAAGEELTASLRAMFPDVVIATRTIRSGS
ncbi:MAG: phenylalanine--tRNA ligase beta subunit-related protein [Thermomicrobiales bacterium]